MGQRIVITNHKTKTEAGLQQTTRQGRPVWQAWVRDIENDVALLVAECVSLRPLVRLLQGEGFFRPV